MRRRTQVFLLVFGVVTLGVGVLIAVGSPDERGFALLGAVPFGIGSVAVAVIPFFTRESGGVALEEVRGRRSGRAVVFPFSKAKQRLGFVGIVCFILLGLALALYTDAEGVVIGWVCVVLFGAMALASAPAVFTRGGGVALLPEGILVTGTVTGFIAWEDLEGLQDVEIHGSRMLGIVASDPAKVETSAASRVLIRLNRALGYETDLNIAAGSLAVDLEVVAEAIEHEHLHPEHRLRLGAPESLVDLGLTR